MTALIVLAALAAVALWPFAADRWLAHNSNITRKEF